jgi:hypothetical protein
LQYRVFGGPSLQHDVNFVLCDIRRFTQDHYTKLNEEEKKLDEKESRLSANKRLSLLLITINNMGVAIATDVRGPTFVSLSML